MVDLPRYVKARTKPSGRVFYYYERYRSTPREWPRLPLPFGPQAPEFWLRCRQYAELDAQRTDAGWTWAWVAPSHRRHPLPDPRAEGGMEAFWRALDTAAEREKLGDAEDRKTFAALIALYREHAIYTKLSALTQRDYERHLRLIAEFWGDDPVADLTTVDAQKAIDSFQATPAVARYFRAVLSRLIAFGIPRGFATANVVEATEKVAHEVDPHEPWPDWAFETFFEHARVGLHLPVYSALYTGQRSIDVIPMHRPAVGANAIEMIARKTGAAVYVPIHSEYREILTRTHVDHPALHLREDGTPWTLGAYRTAWQRDFTSINAKGQPTTASPAKKAAMQRLREGGFVFHGLRKNAVNMLLETGCTEAEVSAIVEMSEQMVRHYARDVNKRRLAVNAMKKLEEGWAETRRNLFGPGTATRGSA
ncbi:integrase [Methylobacterium nodulans]|uniref:Integrase family protein n=1 Tax=Methylobacterium nodulans (strain LMG 21967 / CNCM I-2342 / ORS 2060) TaxID=460265 RepID=B8IE70_METNO|nr:integrase [Methylobacterium nodulans]ACL57616.1 integrase family protein [Methylobacterium nodulans ORS 2060]